MTIRSALDRSREPPFELDAQLANRLVIALGEHRPERLVHAGDDDDARPTDPIVGSIAVQDAEETVVVSVGAIDSNLIDACHSQDDYLAAARRLGFRAIVEGIRDILGKTIAHQKYHHLATSLARLGFLELPADLAAYVYPVRAGLSAKLAEIRVTPRDVPIEVLYVQPTDTADDRCIDFARFAGHVERFDDPFSRLFAAHLRRWTEAAGSMPPAEPSRQRCNRVPRPRRPTAGPRRRRHRPFRPTISRGCVELRAPIGG